MKVSVFSELKNTTSPIQSNVNSILERIKSGGDVKDRVLEIRELYSKDKESYKKQKTKLPIILFNGQFRKRSKDGLVLGNGLAVLDFDNLKDIEGLKNKLKNDQHIYSFFLSPSGAGIKALIKIPVVKTDEHFKEYFEAIQKRYPELDESGKDISRSCFFSFDPDLYINPKAVTYKEKVVEEKEVREVKTYTNYSKLNIALNKIRQSVEGEQHNVLLKMAHLCGGYVAGKVVDENEAIRLLEREFEQKRPDPHYDYKKTIRDGINEGKKKPLTKREQEQLEKYEVGKGKCYFSLFDVRNEFNDVYENGYQRGEYIGWDCAKDKMTVKLGTTLYLYGAPFSGKSQFWNEVITNLSQFQGWKHAIMTPETGTPAEVFAELASMFIGKSFDGDFKMSPEEKDMAIQFVEKHFLVIDPKDKGLSIDEVFDQVDAAEREYNVKIHTVTIDPWNELTSDFNSFGGREDKYLEYVLTKVRQNAQSRNRFVCVVNHVRDQQLKTENNQMYFDVPNPRSLAGGQVWFRKGLLMGCVYRPVDIKGNPLSDENGNPYDKNETHVYIQKAKPKGTSKIGMFRLYYDWKKNKYYEMDSVGIKKYAHHIEDEKKEEAMQPSTEFNTDTPF